MLQKDGERKRKDYEPLRWTEESIASCCPSASSQGWTWTTDQTPRPPSAEGSSAQQAGRRSTQRLPDRLLCAQALPEGTRSRPWALESETCKASDSNTSSTGPRICFGSPYVLNVIEHYWAVTGDSTPASSWQTHPAAGVCLSTQCSKALEGQRAHTHFILSVWMLLMITMDLLFHINRCPSHIKRALDELSENRTWRKQK